MIHALYTKVLKKITLLDSASNCELLSCQLDPSIYESLQKEKVEVGDVIYIEANSGAVKVREVRSYFVLDVSLRSGSTKSRSISFKQNLERCILI